MTKAKAKSAPKKSAKPAAAKSAHHGKPAPKAAAKVEASAHHKKPKGAPKHESELVAAPPVDHELLEQMEEQEEIAALSKARSEDSSNAALNAAKSAAGPDTTSASFKNFRHHPDMENFYRFIYENDLRYEALAIVDEILTEKKNRRKLKALAAGVKPKMH